MTLEIKNYADWVVKDARADCTALGVTLQITNAEGEAEALETAVVEKNSPDSPPGGVAGPGDIISVVIFPLEPRQKPGK